MVKNVKKNNQTKYALFFLVIICTIVYILMLYNQRFVSSSEACVEGRLIEVLSRTSGVLIHMYAEDNQEVKKGDLLLEIDPLPYEIKLRKLETEIKSIKEKLDTCKKIPADEYLKSSYPEYARTYAHIDFIKREEGKVKSDDTTVSKDQNECKMTPSENESEVLNVKALTKRLHELEASASEIKLALSYTKIYAPQDGLVASKQVEEDDYIETGENVLSIIPKRVWIIAGFKQTDVLNAGQPVKIKLKSHPHKIFKGVIDTVPYTINPNTDYLLQNSGEVSKTTVKILFTEDYSEYNITPGTSAVLTVKVK